MRSAARVPLTGVEAPADLESVYETCAKYVWVSLQRLGVRHADLEDVSHDVFLIAHRHFKEFSGTVKVNSWLFGICLRVAANYRRRARFRYELSAGAMTPGEGVVAMAPVEGRPDQQALRREAERRAQAILDAMDLSKRAVFLMFEIEGLSCQAIADELGIPIGTVYSRLHGARAYFEKEAQRIAEEEAR
jgi:RNA polymerase sigma-70 factor (ECF subfamily)